MARLESREIMGFLVMDQKHHEAIFSLLGIESEKKARILDPFAGEGDFLEAAAQAWNLIPYANELEPKRAEHCRERFGASNTAIGDALHLRASKQAFSVLWLNPPYDKFKGEQDRSELKLLKHSLKWACQDAVVFWAVYQHHLSDRACQFLAKQLSEIRIWGLSGKHLGQYDQVLVTGLCRPNPNHEEFYKKLLIEREMPIPLHKLEQAVYQIPKLAQDSKFTFTSEMIDADQALALSQQSGAIHSPKLQEILNREVLREERIQPVVQPRPGHTALVLGTGISSGTILNSEKGRSAVKGKMKTVEEVSRVVIETDPKNSEQQISHTYIRQRPLATINLLGEDGSICSLEGDEGILNFVQEHQQSLAEYLNKNFEALYKFDYHSSDTNLSHFLNSVRLLGKYPLYTAQKHVIAAIVRGLEEKRGIFLVGKMGVVKTALGAGSLILLTSNIVRQLQKNMKRNQISLIICPPHLLDKWRRELHSLYPDIYFQSCRRHEEIRSFMEAVDSGDKLRSLFSPQIQSLFISQSKRLALRMLFEIHLVAEAIAQTSKVMLIKRDMAKLGCKHRPAFVWKKIYVKRWAYQEEKPANSGDGERIISKRLPSCANCGEIAVTTSKGKGETEEETILSETALSRSKHYCQNCHSPLWQEERQESEKAKAGEKFAGVNPRYRLDKYLAKVYRKRIYLLLWDEAHEAQYADRGNGEAFCPSGIDQQQNPGGYRNTI